MVLKRKKRQVAKQSKPDSAPKARNNIDPEIVRRREAAVNRLRTDGYSLREIADALLTAHLEEGNTLFSFVGPDRALLTEAEVAALSHEDLRDRAYFTVKQDVKKRRDEANAEQPDAVRLADDRYVLAERLRIYLRRLVVRMEGDPTNKDRSKRVGEADNGKYTLMMRTAIELATRIARLQGIETEKPIELRLPERYRAWIDEDGIIHREKLAPDPPSEDKPTLPN